MSALNRAWQGWQKWCFGAVDPRRLAMLRIGWALLALWCYLPMADDLDWMLADSGTYSNASRIEDWSMARWNVYANPLWQVTDFSLVQAIFVAGLGLLVLVLFGVGTRITFPLAWIILLSAANRNPVWSDGSDAILRVFGFYMLFMPMGRAWSVDAWIAKAKGWTLPAAPKWPLRLFQIQVCILYVKTGYIKAVQERWQSGEAVWHAMNNQVYWRFQLADVLSLHVMEWFCVAATYGTLVFELGFPLVFLRRARPWVLLGGLGLHLGIWFFLNLGGFSEAILWTYLAFWVPALMRGDANLRASASSPAPPA